MKLDISRKRSRFHKLEGGSAAIIGCSGRVPLNAGSFTGSQVALIIDGREGEDTTGWRDVQVAGYIGAAAVAAALRDRGVVWQVAYDGYVTTDGKGLYRTVIDVEMDGGDEARVRAAETLLREIVEEALARAPKPARALPAKDRQLMEKSDVEG